LYRTFDKAPEEMGHTNGEPWSPCWLAVDCLTWCCHAEDKTRTRYMC